MPRKTSTPQATEAPSGPAIFSSASFVKTRRGGAGRPAVPNPYVEYVASTYETQEPLATPVVRTEALAVLSRLRDAAEGLQLGLNVQIQTPEGEPVAQTKDALAEFPEDAQFTLVFQARERRAYHPRAKATDES